MSKKALVTGSFDPPTVGHLALIEKAARAFDEVIVCIFRNREKESLFSEELRVKMLWDAIGEAGLGNVTVDVSDGFVADYAREKGIGAVVRGVRDIRDMEYEVDMARYNNQRNHDLETFLWVAPDSQKGISSTEARKMLHGGVLSDDILPPAVIRLIEINTAMGKSST